MVAFWLCAKISPTGSVERGRERAPCRPGPDERQRPRREWTAMGHFNERRWRHLASCDESQCWQLVTMWAGRALACGPIVSLDNLQMTLVSVAARAEDATGARAQQPPDYY